MAMANADSGRRQAIATAIAAELDRQGQDGIAQIDTDALATAIDTALSPTPPANEGTRPEDLNATNDG